MTASAQPRSKKCRAPLWPKPVADSSSFEHDPSTVAVASDPVLLRRARLQGGGRNARATSSRLRTCSGFPTGNSPSTITGCRWLCRNHSASSGNFTFRWIYSQPETLHLATQKLRHLVKKLWRMRLPCGRMRKSEKYSSSASSFPCDLNPLHLVKPSLAHQP